MLSAMKDKINLNLKRTNNSSKKESKGNTYLI